MRGGYISIVYAKYMLLLWVSYLARANVAGLNLIFFTPDEVLAYAECIPFTPDEVHILSIYSPLPNFFSPLPSCEPFQNPSFDSPVPILAVVPRH